MQIVEEAHWRASDANNVEREKVPYVGKNSLYEHCFFSVAETFPSYVERFNNFRD